MGTNVINNLAVQEYRVTAAATINSGDLVSNIESGGVIVTPNTLTLSQANPTTAGTSAINAVNSIAGSGYVNSNPVNGIPCMAQLVSGDIVTAYTGNGSVVTTNVNIQFKNIAGGNTYSTIAATTASNVYNPIVRAMPNGGFVVVWGDSTPALRYAIFTSTGGVTKAATTVSTVNNWQFNTNWNAHVLTNNNIVFSYNRANGAYYVIVDASGNSVLAETLIEASSNPQSHCIRPLSGGGFVIYYYRGAATVAYKFARFNASGVMQGSLTTIASAGGPALSGDSTNLCQELNNGNLLFIASSSNYPAFAVYDSSGNSVKALTALLGSATYSSNSYTYQGYTPGVCKTSNGFAVATRGSGTAYFTAYDNTGSQILPVRAIGPGTSATSVNCMLIYNLGNNLGVFDFSTQSNCGTYYYGALYVVNKNDGSAVGSTVVFSNNLTTAIYCPFSLQTADGTVVITYSYTSSALYWGTYNVQRKSILGVAQSSGATGSTIRVATVGTLPLNISYGSGGYVDQRTAVVPGARGSIVGASAILLGLS